MDTRKKILICDDEEGIREALNMILEDNYDLDFASSGQEAIEKVRSNTYHALLLDLKMPVKDGLETLEEIRVISPGLKVIIITGYQSVEIATKAVQLGASDYIPKPFEVKEVLEKVASI